MLIQMPWMILLTVNRKSKGLLTAALQRSKLEQEFYMVKLRLQDHNLAPDVLLLVLYPQPESIDRVQEEGQTDHQKVQIQQTLTRILSLAMMS